MKNKRLGFGLMAIGLSLVSGYASADWATQVEDDVFSGGHTAMMGGGENELNGVVFDCSKDKLKVTYIERADTSDITEGIDVDLIFKIDQNPPIKFNAQTEIRNNNYFGVTANDNDSLKVLLSQMKTASHKMLVGIRYPQNDNKSSFTFSAVGSTAAVSKFVKACEIELPAGPAQKS